MNSSNFKIANLLTKDINNFYMSITPQELDSILFSSSGQEINKFLSHLKENYIKELFKNLSPAHWKMYSERYLNHELINIYYLALMMG